MPISELHYAFDMRGLRGQFHPCPPKRAFGRFLSALSSPWLTASPPSGSTGNIAENLSRPEYQDVGNSSRSGH